MSCLPLACDGSVARLKGFAQIGFATCLFCVMAVASNCVYGDESTPEALAKYADAANFQNNGAIDLAIENWQEFLTKYQDDPLAAEVAHYLGVCLMQRNEPDYPAAIQAFATALKNPEYKLREESLANQGWCFYAASDRGSDRDSQQLEAALKVFSELIEKFPHSSHLDRAFFYSGEAAYGLGDQERAIEFYDRMLKRSDADKNPLHCEALYARGVAQEEAKRLDDAVTSYRQLLKVCKDETLLQDARIRLADILVQQGNNDNAVELFGSALKQGGTHADYAAFRRAFALVQSDAPADAAVAYDQVVEAFPKSPYVSASIMAAGQTYYRSGQLDQAAKRFQDVLSQSDRSAATEAAHWLARIAIREGKLKQAQQIAATEIAKGVEGPYALSLKFDRAEAMSLVPETASDSLDAFVAVYKEDPKSAVASRSLYNAAFTALQEAEYQRAVDLSARFLKNFPDDVLIPDVRYISAEANLVSGKHVEAAEMYASLIDVAKEHPQRPVWVLRGGTAAYLAGNYDDTIAMLQKEFASLSEKSKQAEAHFLIGASHLFSDRFSDAIQALETCRSTEPNWTKADEALLLIGQAHLQSENNQAAQDSWQQVVALYPQKPVADQALYRIGQLAAGAKDYQQAIQSYSSILQRDKAPALIPYAMFGNGWALVQQEKYEEALVPFQQLISKYPKHDLAGEAKLAMGVSLRSLDRIDDAEKWLTEFLAGKPSGQTLGHALYELSAIDIKRQQPAAAVKRLEQLQKDVPDYESMGKVLYDLGWSYKELKKSAPAVAQFQQLIAKYPDNSLVPEASYFIGEQHYESENWSAAAEAFRLTAERSKQDSLTEKALYRLGWSEYQAADYSASEATFDKQAKRFPDGKMFLDALLMIGESRFETKRHQEALQAYSQARKRIVDADENAQNISEIEDRQVRELVLLHGGQSAGQLGDWKDALSWFDQLRERFPATTYLPQVFYESAYAYQQLGDDQQALKLYKQVADKFRNEIAARARFMIGEVYFAKQDLAKAIPEFQRVMYGFGAEKAPVPIKHWQARSGFEAGRCAEILIQSTAGAKRDNSLKIAKEFFEYVIQKHPDHELVSKAKERMEVLSHL